METKGEKMSEWMDIKTSPPRGVSDILIKTDYEDCPIMTATVINNLIVPHSFVQCDEHYLEKPNLTWIQGCELSSVEYKNYLSRFTKWLIVTKISDSME